MKKLDITILRSYEPCYDPTKYLPESWQGDALDIAKNKDIPFADRLWVIMRIDLVSDKFMRLFAVWCARKALKYNDNLVLVDVLNVVERYIDGYVTDNELVAAGLAAKSAAIARKAAAESAAWSASAAAESAALRSASAALQSAAWSAADSECLAARSAAESEQEEQLIKMLESNTGDVL